MISHEEFVNLNKENLHHEIALKKEKIFSKNDFRKRKTKIICTLGYINLI